MHCCLCFLSLIGWLYFCLYEHLRCLWTVCCRCKNSFSIRIKEFIPIQIDKKHYERHLMIKNNNNKYCLKVLKNSNPGVQNVFVCDIFFLHICKNTGSEILDWERNEGFTGSLGVAFRIRWSRFQGIRKKYKFRFLKSFHVPSFGLIIYSYFKHGTFIRW